MLKVEISEPKKKTVDPDSIKAGDVYFDGEDWVLACDDPSISVVLWGGKFSAIGSIDHNRREHNSDDLRLCKATLIIEPLD